MAYRHDLAKKYSNSYKYWTPEDEQYLNRLWKQGFTLDQLTPIFKRSSSSILNRLFKTGIFKFIP